MSEQQFHDKKHIKKGPITVVTFNSDDLSELGKLLAAGQLVFPSNHPVISRIKAAMTRMGLPVPKGL